MVSGKTSVKKRLRCLPTWMNRSVCHRKRLEVKEAILTEREGPKDLTELMLEVGAHMVY